jgi:ATP-binding cassette subfamily B protein
VVLLVRSMSFAQRMNTAFQQAHEVTPYIEEVRAREAEYRSAPRHDATEQLGRVESIRLDGVSFAYEPDKPVLSDLSLTIERGEVIGLVGPSGSGKSTLVQLLLRLREPDAGRYEVNGEDAARFDRASWTRAFAFVPQDNQLLRGTVHENIALFRGHVSAAAAEQAAGRAHLDTDICALPHGYGSEVGSGAADLSGGQRQRLGLARALAGSPEVVVLDEPTSALDMRSEMLVQETLQELKGDVTMIIVAHRLTTLSICDRIVVLQGGRVSAVGTYEELQRDSRFFRDAIELSRLPA